MPTFEEDLQQLEGYIHQPRYEKLKAKDKQRLVGELAQDTELGQWPGDEAALTELSKAKTYPEIGKIAKERRGTFEQVQKARTQTKDIQASDALAEEQRQRSSPAIGDRAKTLYQDVLNRFFPTTPAAKPVTPQPLNTPETLGLPAPMPPPPVPSSRFQVDEGEIIDTKTRQIIPPDQFNRLANPQEKAAVEKALQGGGWMADQPKAAQYNQSPTPERVKTYGMRENGTPKGPGFFGEIPRTDDLSKISTELSATGDLKDKNGKPVLFPLLVPSLTREEINYLISTNKLNSGDPKAKTIEDSIYQKAEAHAKDRLDFGLSPFATHGEQVPLPEPGQPPATSPAAALAGMPPGPSTPQTDPRTGQTIPVLKNEPTDWLTPERVPDVMRQQAKAGLSGLFHSMADRVEALQKTVEPSRKAASPVIGFFRSLGDFMTPQKEITPESVPEVATAAVTRFVTETAPDVFVLRRILGSITAAFGAYGLLKGSEVPTDSGGRKFEGLNAEGAKEALINVVTIGLLKGLAPTSRITRFMAGAGIPPAIAVGEYLAGDQPMSPAPQLAGESLAMGVMGAMAPGNPALMRAWRRRPPGPEQRPPIDITPPPEAPPAQGLPGPGPLPPGPPGTEMPQAPAKTTPRRSKMPVAVTPGVSSEPPPEAQVLPVPMQPMGQPPAPIVVPGPIQTPSVAHAPVAQMPQAMLPPQEPAPSKPIEKPEAKAPTVEDIHALADAKGIPYDNNKQFMALTKKVTGEAHLDALGPAQRQQMIDTLNGMKTRTPTAVIESKPEIVKPTTDTQVDAQAQEAATSPTNALPIPTESQEEAGNYKKGHVSIAGLDISIEHPEGSIRSGTDKAGKPWSMTMKDHYGYITGTKGKDKDHLDVFIKPGTPDNYAGLVFVVNQQKPDTKQFDEHKIILGVNNEENARALYQQNYEKGATRIQSVTTFNMPEFKEWLKKADHTQPAKAKPTERGSFPANPFAAKVPEPVIGVTSEDGRFHSHDAAIEARYQIASKGISKETLLQRLKEYADTFRRRATRKYEFLPDTAEFARLQFALDNLEKQKAISAELQMRALHEIVGALSDQKMDLFTRKVILMDLKQEADAGRLLPYGYTSESVTRDLADVNHLVTLNPQVQTAWEQRQALWTEMKRRYVQAMDAIGFDVAQKVSKEDYFRHQVLAYAQEMAGPPTKGTGERVRTPTGRSFLKQRTGSTYDINANYLQAEFEVLAQMDYDVHLAQVIQLIDEVYNISDQLTEEARKQNDTAFRGVLAQHGEGSELAQEFRRIRQKLGFHTMRLKQALHLEEDDTVPKAEIERLAADPTAIGHGPALGYYKWIDRKRALIKPTLGEQFKTAQDLIPDGYDDEFQPREGNVFYMADTIPHQMVQQLMEHMGETMGITAADLRKVVAMGGRQKAFILPTPVSQTLLHMKKPEYNIVARIQRELMGMWKAGKLIGPHTVIKYWMRNQSGDMEAGFVGNTSGFKKGPRATKELMPLFYGQRTLTGEVDEWFRRGGVGTLLQINEMGDINDLLIFKHLQQRAEQRGLLSVPAKVFSKYWKSARLATDYREAILRYANYLDYLEQMQRDPEGRPKNFGFSIKDTVMALPDLRDRAFKLSNELIGAFDRVSVMGQHIANYWWPFWRWKEVNFSRYKQMMKNVFRDRDYSQGKRAAAYKSAAILLKLAFVYGGLQVWNHLIFPNEERDLNENVRNRVHIILPPGRTEDGRITYLAGVGAIGDLLAWVGADSAISHAIGGDLLHDRMTLKELAKEMLKAPFNVIAQGIGPFPIKLPAEEFAQQSSYPDVFNPQAIRDPAQHAVQQLTPFGEEYKAVTGKPSKGYFSPDSLRNLITSTQDPGSAAYHNWQAIEDKWRGRMGKPSYSSYQRSPKGQALADWAQSLRLGDQAGIQKYRQQFIEAGGDLKAMVASVRALAPLTGLTKDERAYVLGNLETQEKQVLKKAEQYYLEQMMSILPPLQRTELLGSLMEHGGLSSSIVPRKVLPPKLPDVLNRVP